MRPAYFRARMRSRNDHGSASCSKASKSASRCRSGARSPDCSSRACWLMAGSSAGAASPSSRRKPVSPSSRRPAAPATFASMPASSPASSRCPKTTCVVLRPTPRRRWPPWRSTSRAAIRRGKAASAPTMPKTVPPPAASSADRGPPHRSRPRDRPTQQPAPGAKNSLNPPVRRLTRDFPSSRAQMPADCCVPATNRAPPRWRCGHCGESRRRSAPCGFSAPLSW